MSNDEQDSKIHKLEEDEKILKDKEKELGMEYFKLNQRLKEIEKEQLELKKKIKLGREFRQNLKRESQTQINKVNIMLKDEMDKVGVDDLKKDVGFKPSTTIHEGIEKFVSWFLYTQQK